MFHKFERQILWEALAKKRGLTSLTDVFSGGDHPLKLGAKRRERGKDP